MHKLAVVAIVLGGGVASAAPKLTIKAIDFPMPKGGEVAVTFP